MNSNALSIQRLINVSVNLTPNGAQIQNINTLLILGSSDIVDVVQRYRSYSALSEVAQDFGTSAPEYLAAVLWFEQTPQPSTLQIGRWAETATQAIIEGASLSSAQQSMSAWNAITAPGFLEVIDGVPVAVAPASLAPATNLNGVASTVQTALNANLASQLNIAVLTTAQVSSLTTAQVAALPLPIITALTTADVRTLSTSQVSALTTSEVYALTTANIAALTTTQTAALNTAQISALSARQIATLPIIECTWDANYESFSIQDATSGIDSTLSFASAPAATGNYSFGITQPTNTDTVVLGGTSIAFTSGIPVGNQVAIGVDVPTTIQNLAAFIQASVDINLVKFKPYPTLTNLYLVASTAGAGGNSLTITAAGASPPTASGATLSGGSSTDISTMLGMTAASSGAYVVDGIAAESAVNCVALFDANYGQNWYAVTVLGAADADVEAIASYIDGATNKHLQGATTQETAVLSSVDTTSLPYVLMQANHLRTMTQFSSSNPYAVCSLLAKALTIDYQANNSVITLMYKQEPGIVPETLNTNQVDALESKNCNVFVAYNNNTAIIEPGVMADGNFIDVVTGTDWLALSIQTNVYNLLYTSPTKIPQTDAGNNQLVNAIEQILAQGEINDLLGPGQWNSQGFGSLKQGDFMPTGYYVYAPPISSQLESLRTTRVSVPIQVAAKLSGAIQKVDILINVNQ